MAKSKKYDAAKAVLDNLPPPTGEDVSYWEKNLELTDKLRVVASVANIHLILTKDDRWQEVLGFDEFSNQVMKRKPPPFEGGRVGPWDDDDDWRTMIWLSHHYRFNADKRAIMGAVLTGAKDHRYHPVREYFASLKWDGKERLPSWLAEYLGASEGEYSRAVGIKFMVGAVARVMRPGCKMDTVLILEGEQGRWKSTALATLAGDWFGDTPFTIGDKDAYLVMRGHLIYEMAELDALSRADDKRAKAFFSSSSDTYVPKYVAWAIKVPRQLVFAGTVNHGVYLRDTTGSRRYWPVRVERADIERLKADRDQLWAEAVHRYNEGTRWWVEPDQRELFEQQQELRYVGDAYEERVHEWTVGKNEFTMSQVLADCLKLETGKWSRAEQTRVGEVLQKLDWQKFDRGSDKPKAVRYIYRRREREPGEEG